jgi:hypothetical protein
LRIYGGSDYAVTADGGDYTVHFVIGLNPEGRMYLLDRWRKQSASDEWIEAFCDLVNEWSPVGWAEEKGGTPKGARNRLGTQFLEALEADFNKFGPQAIALVREKKPEVYIKVVADLLPKEANINVEAGEAFVNLWRRISDGLGEELANSLDAEQEQSAPVRH